MDSCFIHRYKSTQKLFQIAVKIGQILFRNGHTNAFLVDCEQSLQPSCTELSHPQCVCKILTTYSIEMDTISRIFTFGLFETILWILLIISGVVISHLDDLDFLWFLCSREHNEIR